MRKYSYGINSYHKTASLFIEDASWHVFFVLKLNDIFYDVISWIQIPLPKIKFKLKEEDKEYGDKDGYTNLKEWFGDTSTLYHICIYSKIFYKMSEKIDFRVIKLDYEDLKIKMIKYDKKLWERQEKIAKDIKKENESK